MNKNYCYNKKKVIKKEPKKEKEQKKNKNEQKYILASCTSPSLNTLRFKIQNNLMCSNHHNTLTKHNPTSPHVALYQIVEHLFVEKAHEQKTYIYLKQIPC